MTGAEHNEEKTQGSAEKHRRDRKPHTYSIINVKITNKIVPFIENTVKNVSPLQNKLMLSVFIADITI